MVEKILIATTDEDKDTQIAKLKATLEEEQKARKALDEEKEKVEAKLKATEDEDKMEHAKKAIKAALDEEEDETKKASLMKAMEVFDTGNGVNTNATDNTTEEEKEQTAVIATLSAKVAEPIITKILTAKAIAGIGEKEIDEERTRLSALSLPALEKEFKSQEVFINNTLSANQDSSDTSSLVASVENSFEFNGIQNGPLIGKTVSLDVALGDATLQ